MTSRYFCIPAMIIFIVRGRADTTPTCTVNVANQPTVRTEGITELIGDVLLACTGGTPTAAGKAVPVYNFTITLNTGVTNPVIVPNSAFTTALLAINDPPPANQVLAPVSAASGLSFTGTLSGTGTGVNYAAGGTPNFFLGRQLNANSITWTGIPVDLSGNTPTTVRITNIRANASQLANLASGPPPITVNLLPIPGLTIINPNQTVAFVQPGLCIGREYFPGCTGPAVTTGSAKHDKPYNFPFNPSTAVASANLNIREGFAASFKQRVVAPQNTLGTVHPTNAGFTNTAFGAGFSPSVPGTLLQTSLAGIPSGVSAYMPTQPVFGAATMQLTSPNTSVGGGLSQLPVSAGSATAVYEVVNTDPNIGSYNIPVYFSYNSGGTIATAPSAPTTIYSAQSFVTNEIQKSLSAFETQEALFIINSATGLTPELFGTIDTRPCYAGPTFDYPGNSCAPFSGPRVSVTSDSGPLNPSASATSNGVSISFPVTGGGVFSGATPVNGVLRVDGSKAAPGTYPNTLTFTAPGSANSLTLPLSLVVLPADNPIIRPQGFADALSYQSGSVAAGQIFTVFGENFGPPAGTLLSASLDASGKLPSSVGGGQLTFDGIPAPLLYITHNQLAGVAPVKLVGKFATILELAWNGKKSPPITLPVAAPTISISSANASGGGGGAILNQDLSLNTPSNPARTGDTVIIYAAYSGPLTVPVTDGRTTTGPPYPAPTGPVSVTFGGVAATSIPYFGNAPTFLESVMQINVVVPPGVKADSAVPVILSAGGATSPAWCTIAVK